MGSINTTREFLQSLGFHTVSDVTFDHINEWLEWYQGDVEKFHKYKIYNGKITTEHSRYGMGMAKKVCEDWANLIINEKLAIKTNKEYDEQLENVLEANNFRVRGNQLVEQSFALGTGAFVEYLDANENPVIDYIRADMIYPLSWENGDITECAFGSVRVIDGKEIIYLQIHRLGNKENGEYTDIYYIENRYVDAETGKEVEVAEDVVPVICTQYDKPLFQIIMPNICNNIDLDSPMGISVYANAIPQLKGCDLIYDSYINEFVLGRKRVLVPITMAKQMMQENGVSAPIFDANDTVFYQMPQDRNNEMKLTEVDMKIRAEEHELGIQRSLDLLSLKVGMGTGRFQFNTSGVKTATEVISDKSDLYQNLKRNEIPIRNAIVKMVEAIAFLDIGTKVTVTIDFDDSIIEDSNTTIDRNIKLVGAGLRSKITAIMEINQCSERDAKKELERIIQESRVIDIDWTDMEDNNESESENDHSEKEEKEESSKTNTGEGSKENPSKDK